MTKSAKGDTEAHETNVQAKAGLNREIRKSGWASVQQMLNYKVAHAIEVNPAYTSQTCQGAER
ncbi:MAG: hypothetical protein OXE94_14105 [Aestuariivita sp.]|nr:hypothetical protein [Aestuariivita sp.]MCY4202303.1 hypothetical protein [Aestuariivita sp.]